MRHSRLLLSILLLLITDYTTTTHYSYYLVVTEYSCYSCFFTTSLTSLHCHFPHCYYHVRSCKAEVSLYSQDYAQDVATKIFICIAHSKHLLLAELRGLESDFDCDCHCDCSFVAMTLMPTTMASRRLANTHRVSESMCFTISDQRSKYPLWKHCGASIQVPAPHVFAATETWCSGDTPRLKAPSPCPL